MKTIQFAVSAVCALLSVSALADTSDIIATNNQVGIQSGAIYSDQKIDSGY